MTNNETAQRIKIKKLGHLGLVAGMCKELEIAEIINEHIPQDNQKLLSHGDGVVAMILNGLGFTGMPLYMTQKYFEDKPMELLLGNGIEANNINDTALGRTLDKLYEHDITKLFSKISSSSVVILGLKSKIGHLDSSAFHTHTTQDKSTEDGEIEIVKGHSKDHRPDLNQIALNLIVENRAKLPIYLEACSGNQSDKVKFGEIVEKQIDNLKIYHGIEYIIVDSALYTKNNIEKLKNQEIFWITRVPNGLKIVKDEILQINLKEFETIDKNYSYIERGIYHNDENQRWLIVHSKDKKYKDFKTTVKKFATLSNIDLKAIKKFEKQKFACLEDTLKALEILKKELKITEVKDFLTIKHERYSTPGKKKKDAKKDITEYTLSLTISTNLTKFNKERKQNGIFVLATNELNEERLKITEILNEYKNQQKVERGFRFLKDPKFHTDSIFLKKSERIAALMMIMTLCLLVYSALEHKIRKNLEERDITFPNQKGKPIKNPTVRWIFQYFYSVVFAVVDYRHYFDYFDDNHRLILEILGDNYVGFYS